MIEILARDYNLFASKSFKVIILSQSNGIKAVIGKLKADIQGDYVVQAYWFDKQKWNVSKAQAWVKDNAKRDIENIIFLYKEHEMGNKQDSKITKYNCITVKNVDEDSKTIKAVVSTPTKDRDNEIILTRAWKKNLKSFMKHPVLLSSHKYREGLMSQIGEAKNVEIKDDSVEMDFQYYAGQGNKEADWGWFLAKNKKAMFSVGFIPVKSVMPGEEKDLTEDVKEALTQNPRRVFTEVELLEVSQVVVGSNRGALQMGIDNPTVEQCNYMYDVVKSFGNDIPDFEEIKHADDIETKEQFECECIKCGHKVTSEKHCKELKCEKCGGQMRRAERPGPGQDSEKPKAIIDESSTIIAPIEVQNMKELEQIMQIYKSGRVISEKNRTTIKSAIEQLDKSIVALKTLLSMTEPKVDDEKSVIDDFDVDAFIAKHKHIIEKS